MLILNMHINWSSIASNPFFQIGVSIIIAVVSAGITIVIYRLQIKERVPLWSFESFSLIRNYTSEVKGLQILYNGSPIQILTRTNIYLWNGGKLSIRRGDIAPADLLRIIAPDDITILNVELVAPRSVNGASAMKNQDGSRIDLTFEFLDFQDGFLIQCLHTGTVRTEFLFEGTIIDATPIQRVNAGIYMSSMMLNSFSNFATALSVIFATFTLFSALHVGKAVLLIVGIILILIAVILTSVIIRNFFRARYVLPKALRFNN